MSERTTADQEMATSQAAARHSSISKRDLSAGEFTPGPWIAIAHDVVALSDIKGPAICSFPGTMQGCTDARLIAAAPELVAELIALLEWARPFGAFRDDVGQGVENHVRAAISKATGA